MGGEDATASTGADTLIDNTLAIIVESLDHLLPSPKTREVRAKAGTFRRAVDRWTTTPPSDEQRAALRDLVVALHAETMALEKRHKSYRSIRVGARAQESGTHSTVDMTEDPATASHLVKGARGR